jgi:hypothetical protein
VGDPWPAGHFPPGLTTPRGRGKDGGLIAGHARVLAARQLGIAEIPVMVAAGWTEAQKRAYVLADNQLAITGSGWDPELLRLELGELKLGGFDLSLTGFGDLELKDLLAERTEGLTDPDDAPAAPEHPVSQTGHLWLLGKHRLLCGDSTVVPLRHRVRAPVAREAAGNQRPWPADQVERWAIDRLIPYAKNAGVHSDAQIAAIAASIKVKAKAQWAEDHGFVWFSVMDHLIQISGVGAPDEPFMEGWTVLSALAAVTSRIRLATLATSVGYRNPAHLAKITAGVDLISRGRLTLGIGAGYFETEYSQYGGEHQGQDLRFVADFREADNRSRDEESFHGNTAGPGARSTLA